MTPPTWTSFVRDLTQTLFFIVVGIVTVLTYLKAKRTILQPIRTETFKEQLRAFTEVLGLFGGKTEMELRRNLHLPTLLRVNATAMFDRYARLFFDVDFEEAQRPYNRDACPASWIPAELLEKFDGDTWVSDKVIKEPRRDPNVRAANWGRFRLGEIRLPKEFCVAFDELKHVMSSPLLPSALVTLLQEYVDRVNLNVQLVDTVLTECAQEMPVRYPSWATLEESAFFWIDNRYNAKFQPLEEKAKQVSNYLRKYFSPDTLMEG